MVIDFSGFHAFKAGVAVCWVVKGIVVAAGQAKTMGKPKGRFSNHHRGQTLV